MYHCYLCILPSYGQFIDPFTKNTMGGGESINSLKVVWTVISQICFSLYEVIQISAKNGNLLEQCPGSIVDVANIPIAVRPDQQPSLVQCVSSVVLKQQCPRKTNPNLFHHSKTTDICRNRLTRFQKVVENDIGTSPPNTYK